MIALTSRMTRSAMLEALAESSTTFGFEFENFDWGGDYYRAHGVMMPDNGLDALRGKRAVEGIVERLCATCAGFRVAVHGGALLEVLVMLLHVCLDGC